MTSTFHIAIIMDGNGRWAQQRKRPRSMGHVAGAQAVRAAVGSAIRNGVGVLTLYAFSADNWKRPRDEVNALMEIFEAHLQTETAQCLAQGIRLSVVGRRDRLPDSLTETIEWAETTTAAGSKLHLRLAIDYSARESLVQAARLLQSSVLVSPPALGAAVRRATHADPETPDVDLLIRTGGELRMSDLHGWDCAYAELWFSNKMWPDFSGDDLAAAIADFRGRQRRFGGLAACAA